MLHNYLGYIQYTNFPFQASVSKDPIQFFWELLLKHFLPYSFCDSINLCNFQFFFQIFCRCFIFLFPAFIVLSSIAMLLCELYLILVLLSRPHFVSLFSSSQIHVSDMWTHFYYDFSKLCNMSLIEDQYLSLYLLILILRFSELCNIQVTFCRQCHF